MQDREIESLKVRLNKSSLVKRARGKKKPVHGVLAFFGS